MAVEREVLEVDALVVGGGPAGLACALHLKRLLAERAPEGGEAMVTLIEKAGAFGNHALSGAVMDPRGLRELIPDYEARRCPIEGEVRGDAVMFLSRTGARRFPIMPPPLQNHGNLLVSLNRLTTWLAERCEEAGVDLFPGFAGQELLWDGERIVGVRTGDKGLDKEGKPKGNFEPGVDIRAKVTVLAEGVRGNLTKTLLARVKLDEGKNPQSYATGAKEVWEVPDGQAGRGRVFHTVGFPLDRRTYGGGWIYEMGANHVSLGIAVGLDSGDPFLDAHRLLQEFKTHPFVRARIAGGKLFRYGAKAIPEGGYWALPRPYAAGVLLAGDAGGYLNAQRLKGIHLAIKTGMMAAETVHECLLAGDTGAARLAAYEARIHESWVHAELYGCRNFRQAFQGGLFSGMMKAGIQLATGGRGLTARLGAKPDHQHFLTLAELRAGSRSADPPPLVADDPERLVSAKLTSVFHSGTLHEENQPCHLRVADPEICRTRCTEEYGNPCEHFCPASVYHMVPDETRGGKRLQIDFTNCVHCKTCDILDPYEIITWVPPQGGDGPIYTGL
jgi:electron-transferring-flavoprotein dehydrogenase